MMVERRVHQLRERAIGEFRFGPVRQRGLLVVEEDAAVLDRWRALRARKKIDLVMLRDGDVGPPKWT